MRFCVRWMGNCRDIGDQQELEPPPDVPPNEVRDKKRLRRPKIRPQRWPTKIKRRPEIKGDVCVEMKFAPPTFFLSSVPFRETTPILQNRKKKPTFPGKLSNKDWKTRLLFSNWTSRRWPDWLRYRARYYEVLRLIWLLASKVARTQTLTWIINCTACQCWLCKEFLYCTFVCQSHLQIVKGTWIFQGVLQGQ